MERYDLLWPELFDPTLVESTVDFLAGWAGSGPALELKVGTGRIAQPLSQRGIRVHGIELSRAMVEQLQAELPETTVSVTVGDLATTSVDEQFTLVYLLCNTITNLTSQGEQVEAFRNAERHLHPGGHSSSKTTCPSCDGCRRVRYGMSSRRPRTIWVSRSMTWSTR